MKMLYSEKPENSSTASPWKLGDRVRKLQNHFFNMGWQEFLTGALDSDLSSITNQPSDLAFRFPSEKWAWISKIPFILGILRVCPESPDGPQLFELSFMDCSVPGATKAHCGDTLKRTPVWLI